MAAATFRFYEELNDFLAPERRKRSFVYSHAPGESVKHAIEALGVPHTEVELILANGQSVDFKYILREGDRVAVYPQFEALDVTPLLKVRSRPLRCPRFIADVHLGGLAKSLRLLGFDTLYRNTYTDEELARVSADEGRIVLTRDRELLMHKSITHGYYVRATRTREQLQEVISRLDLYRAIDPFTRCLRCNRLLEPVAKEEIGDRLPPKIDRLYDEFWICRGCDKIYWEGSHWKWMSKMVEEVLRQHPAGPKEG